jgi:potassium efflux system protein
MHAVAKRHLLTIQIEQAMDGVFLLRSLVALEQAHDELQGLPVAVPDVDAAPADLGHSVELLDGIEKGLQPILDLIRRKQDLLTHEIELLPRNSAIEKAAGEQQYRIEKDALRSLIDRFQGQADALSGLLDQMERQRAAFQDAYKAASARSLASRQRLPRDPHTWMRIGTELEHLPATLGKLVTSVARDLRGTWLQSHLAWRLLFVVLEILWLGFILRLDRLGRPSAADLETRQSFSAKARTVSLALLRSLRWTLLPGGALVLAAWFLRLPPRDLHFLVLLVAVAFGGHLTIGLSRWIFISALIPPEKRQPTVHRGVVGVTLAMAVLVVLGGLGHLGLFCLPSSGSWSSAVS